MSRRIAVVGGGLAGALLAWRLHQRGSRADLYVGGPARPTDATDASGGLVRGFETDPQLCADAATGLAELLGDECLRDWSAYRPTGSCYLLPAVKLPEESVAAVSALLPGSLVVTEPPAPFRGLPPGTAAVVERLAGNYSPARLRRYVVDFLESSDRITVHRRCAVGVTDDPAVCLEDGTTVPYDAVVVAAGAWTGGLLEVSGLAPGGLRTKQIQYVRHPYAAPGLPAFVDETTGLYGRPTANGGSLLGLPGDRWEVDPASPEPDGDLAAATVACARERLGLPAAPGPSLRCVAAVDSYHPAGRLALREVARTGLFTFAGGSGSAAKAILATSRAAAAALLD